MKPLPLLLLIGLFQACISPAQLPKAADCSWPGASSDTAQFADFKQNMPTPELPELLIPVSDTMYCLRGTHGWGAFDYLCTVYRDSTGYKAALISKTSRRDAVKITCKQQITPISPLVWKQVGADFEAQNFWCDAFTPDSLSCNDCAMYRIWVRQGKKFRLVEWDDFETKLETLKVRAKKLRDLCGFPQPTAQIGYLIEGDSIKATVFNMDLESDVFTTKVEVKYDRKILLAKGGVVRLVLPKKDFRKLKGVQITEYGIDGSVIRYPVDKISEGDY